MALTWPCMAKLSTELSDFGRRMFSSPEGRTWTEILSRPRISLPGCASHAEQTMLRAAAVNADRDPSFSGYAVSYDQDEIQFPVWVLMTVGAALLFASIVTVNAVLALLSTFAAGFAYHNYPLLETGTTRLGANQHGLFIEGLGLLAWRSIASIHPVEVFVRGSEYTEAEISVSGPLQVAIIEKAPDAGFRRRLMRKPFYLGPGSNIRIPLNILDRAPDEVMNTITRTWLYYKNRGP